MGIAKRTDRAHDRGWRGDTDEDPSVSFKLLDGRYLRHSNYYIRANKGSDALFRLDATFRQSRDFVSADTMSYQSVNYPDRYLGCENTSRLLIAPKRVAVGFSIVHAESE